MAVRSIYSHRENLVKINKIHVLLNQNLNFFIQQIYLDLVVGWKLFMKVEFINHFGYES